MILQNALASNLTIADVLEEFGVHHERNRCARPIHGGNNRTSFSFNDSGFNCFSCGASGGIITLVQNLGKTDYRGAMEFIRSRFGVAVSSSAVSKCGATRHAARKQRKREPLALSLLKDRFNTLELLNNVLSHQLAMLEKRLEDGVMVLDAYYVQLQKLDQSLCEIDAELTRLRYSIRHFGESDMGGRRG